MLKTISRKNYTKHCFNHEWTLVQTYSLQHEHEQLIYRQDQRNQKSDNLQYNTLVHWVNRLIDSASDGPSIILID